MSRPVSCHPVRAMPAVAAPHRHRGTRSAMSTVPAMSAVPAMSVVARPVRGPVYGRLFRGRRRCVLRLRRPAGGE